MVARCSQKPMVRGSNLALLLFVRGKGDLLRFSLFTEQYSKWVSGIYVQLKKVECLRSCASGSTPCMLPRNLSWYWFDHVCQAPCVGVLMKNVHFINPTIIIIKIKRGSGMDERIKIKKDGLAVQQSKERRKILERGGWSLGGVFDRTTKFGGEANEF